MEMTNCSLNEPDKDILDAIELWYESKRSKRGNVNRNVMAVGIGISELLQNRFPLTDDYVQSDKGSQVRGLSGACIKTVLARHGERVPSHQRAAEPHAAHSRWRLSLPQLSTLPYPVTLAKTLVLKLRMQSPISSSSESRSISLTGRESKSKSIFKNQFLSLSMIS